ncbi:MAG: PKD domain-containing protein [Anaerolineaceae bacterium]
MQKNKIVIVLLVITFILFPCGEVVGIPATVGNSPQETSPGVLIISDNQDTATDEILTAYGIGFTKVGPSEMAEIDLAPYGLVIIPGLQSSSFYTAWNANLARFEGYVSAGGALWFSAAAGSYISPKPLIPGGVTCVSAEDNSNQVSSPSHPWAVAAPEEIKGHPASLYSFANLLPGSVVVIGNSLSGATLVDYRMGNGRVLITGQLLEVAYNSNWDFKSILPNSLLDLYFWSAAGRPRSLSNVQVIDAVTQDTLQICNESNHDLAWSASEQGGVLIIQDVLPQGFNSIQDTLIRFGVAYDQVDSAQMEALTLAPYDLIIIPSNQPSSFYTAWNTYLDKFEAYVINGGRLWMSTSAEDTTSPEPLLLGGVVNTNHVTSETIIPTIQHAWIFGVPQGKISLGGTDILQNLAEGSVEIATSGDASGAVLVDYPLGKGRVLVSGLPLEKAWAEGQVGGQILQNALLDMLSGSGGAASAGSASVGKEGFPDAESDLPTGYEAQINSNEEYVLIFQDNSVPAIEEVLHNNGISYEMVSATLMPTIDLSPYSLVIIPGLQSQAFYTAWNTSLAKFEAYISAGGALWLSTATSTSTLVKPDVPGGVETVAVTDTVNKVVTPTHPWVAGVPGQYFGDSLASYNQFKDLAAGSITVASDQNGYATLVDYRMGAGRVLITAQPLEQAYSANLDSKPILPNTILDLLAWDPPDMGVPWLSVSPTFGRLTEGTCTNLVVTYDSNGLTIGGYTAHLALRGINVNAIDLGSQFINVPSVIMDVPVNLTVKRFAVDFSTNTTTGVAPLQVAFTDETVGDHNGWFWDFGDEATSSEPNPTHTYTNSGVYSVSLTAYWGEAESDTRTCTDYITVSEAMEAGFNGNPISGIAPLTVEFTNASTGDYDTSSWDFGDGATSSEPNPTHTYTTPGVYSVSLTAYWGEAESDTKTRTNYITVYKAIKAGFSGDPISGIVPLTVKFTNTSTGNYDISNWDFGDGATSSEHNPTHTYQEADSYTVRLTVSGQGGSATETRIDFIRVEGQKRIFLPLVLR